MIKNVDALASHVESSIKEFCDIAVVGISGGVDSATVASICTRALGKENTYLVSMPYNQTDKDTFNSRSAELAERLGANHFVVDIRLATDGLMASLDMAFGDPEYHVLVQGNTRARMRMATLYAVAQHLGFDTGKRVRVIGTGNASEDLIGYDTKGGDALCDIFPIGEIFKSEVYELARHYGVPDSILNAEPSAGLYPDQTDEQELGFNYNELEPAQRALFELLENGVEDSEIVNSHPIFEKLDKERVEFVVGMFHKHYHKHRAPKVVKVRSISGLVE